MRLAIITHAEHGKDSKGYFAYGPYVREMNLWIKSAQHVEVVAPLVVREWNPIHLHYEGNQVELRSIPGINFQSLRRIVQSIFRMPGILWMIFRAMQKADHIHLRCPGNIGLLGCFVQVLFPHKPKTAKYAGNWDPASSQPMSYRLQKWILNNRLLTRNMQVLVYGEWPNTSKNIKPFYTATYTEAEKTALESKPLQAPYEWLFVGSLSPGKQPLYALDLFEAFVKEHPQARLRYFGEGVLRSTLEHEIANRNLSNQVFLEGNQTKETVEQAYRDGHFLVLVSKSEGWPKVVAEAMFWGCVPLASKVSCVPYMLGHGERGILLSGQMERDQEQLKELLSTPERFEAIRVNGIDWSRGYTLDQMNHEIKALLVCESYN